jgi:hypothetical protein
LRNRPGPNHYDIVTSLGDPVNSSGPGALKKDQAPQWHKNKSAPYLTPGRIFITNKF